MFREGWRQVTPRAEQSRAVAKRRAILKAATELLYSEGLRGVTHRNVAARAGVPVGSIGYYYSNRERLLATCFEDIAGRRRGFVDKQLAEGVVSDAGALAEIVVRVIAGGDIAHMNGLVTATVDAQHESPELLTELEEHWRGVIESVQAVLDTASFSALDGKQVVRSVIGAAVCVMMRGNAPGALVDETETILNEGSALRHPSA